jgi:DNA primase
MPRISEEKIDEVRSAINIVHYIGQFINLKKAGQNYKGLCPFHTEKTPSFVVSPEKQIFHCFGCGKGGNLFTFMMDYEKLNFLESVYKAADFAGIKLPLPESDEPKTDYFQKLYATNEIATRFFEDNLFKPQNKAKLKYFLDRQISEKTIRSFRLGYAPDARDRLVSVLTEAKADLTIAQSLGLIQTSEHRPGYIDKFRHRVMFTFQVVSGKIIGFGGRKLREEQQPKYLNSPESPVYKKGEILYGLHQAIRHIREKDFVLLVEGYFDLLRLVENQIKNVVASSGTALSVEQARLIRRYTHNILIAYDGDDAGINAAIRNAYIIEQADCNASVIVLPAGEDPDSYVLKNGSQAFQKLAENPVIPLNFEIDTFLKAQPNPTLAQKEQFTAQLMEKLSEIKNPLKTGLYIHQISEKMKISESLLIEQLNRQKQRRKRYQTSSRFESEPIEENKPKTIRSGMYNAELGILGLLLSNQPDIKNYINEHINYDLFENKEIVKLYDHVMLELEEKGRVSIDQLITTFQENEIMKSILSELALAGELQSMKYARDCIFQLKKWNLEKKARELSQLIKEEAGSEDSVFHYSQQLMEIRREISQMDKIRREQNTRTV